MWQMKHLDSDEGMRLMLTWLYIAWTGLLNMALQTRLYWGLSRLRCLSSTIQSEILLHGHLTGWVELWALLIAFWIGWA